MTKPLLAVNVGVDVGKSQLDLYLLERDRALTVPNHEQAIAALIRRLSRYRIERIVVEATGRLEQPFVRAALAAGLPVIVVSPLKIRRFADAIGQLATTDEIDARLIARFAAAVKPLARPASDANAQAIKDLTVRRRQLVSLRTMEKNWIKIFSSTNYYQAEIVKQMLIENQIDTVLLNKQDSSHRTFGNIEVYIHQQDFSNAIEAMILNQINL